MPKTPIRCFEGDAKPYEPFWKWTDSAEMPEMEIDGVISEYSWFDDDITPKLTRENRRIRCFGCAGRKKAKKCLYWAQIRNIVGG